MQALKAESPPVQYIVAPYEVRKALETVNFHVYL